MGGEVGIGPVDLRLVEAGLRDPGLQVVGHELAGRAAEEGQHADMGADPVRQRLRPGRFHIGVVRGAEHADEDLRLAHLARGAVDDLERVARIVHEGALAGEVMLAHGRRQAALPAAVELAEPAVPVAVVWMGGAVLLPDERERDLLAFQRAVHRRPVGRCQSSPGLAADRTKETLFEIGLAHAVGQRPGQAGPFGPLQILACGRLPDPQARRDLPRRQPGRL